MRAPPRAPSPGPALQAEKPSVPAATSSVSQEALRQQTLLAVLWGDAPADVVWPWLKDGPLQDGGWRDRGLAAHRANAAEIAERALAAAYPVVQQLLGEGSFAALARTLWRQHAPQAGDLGLWGDALVVFLADAQAQAPELDVPYLPDVARVEWAVHLAARAADATPVQGLHLLGESDPAQLLLQLAPGTALVASRHPVFSIWWAHQSASPDDQEQRMADARAALAAGVAQSVLVRRQGWKPELRLLTVEETRFAAAVLAGRSLGAALDEAGADFGFEAWLIGAVQQRSLVAVQTVQAP
jgi:Putative DNA-binding domain